MQELTMKEMTEGMTPDERFALHLISAEGYQVNVFKLDLFIEYLNLGIQKVA